MSFNIPNIFLYFFTFYHEYIHAKCPSKAGPIKTNKPKKKKTYTEMHQYTNSISTLVYFTNAKAH